VRSKLRAQAAYSTLIATQRELERRATITAFAKAVRHDVGNALQRLLAFLYQVDQFANTAREGVRFIGAQVQGLSDLVDAGGEERLTIFFVRQWLEESVRLVTFGARPSIVRNECLPDFDAQIQAFWPNLLATLTELVLNAATMITQDREQTGKAQSGEIVLTAERFNRDSSPWVRVTVADDGPGVPEDIRGTLFDERVTSRRDQGGTGLGLYFARRRIERAGGTIRYEPNEPRGTRFIIELPEAQEPAT
jgi:signal transduction histidine kinase